MVCSIFFSLFFDSFVYFLIDLLVANYSKMNKHTFYFFLSLLFFSTVPYISELLKIIYLWSEYIYFPHATPFTIQNTNSLTLHPDKTDIFNVPEYKIVALNCESILWTLKIKEMLVLISSRKENKNLSYS